MNWGAAANGFLDGFERGTAMRDRNKQRKLQEAAQEFEKEQQLRAAKLREEQFAFDNKKFEQSMGLQTRAFDEQLADNAWGREFKIGQANRADALAAEQLKFDREQLASRERAAAAANSTRMQGQIIGQLQDAMNAYNAKPKINAEIERMQAQSAALLAKANGLAGGGSGEPAGTPADPQAQVYQQAIDAERRKIAEQQVGIAGGSPKAGWFTSRQSIIDDSNRKIAALEGLLNPPAAGAASPMGGAPAMAGRMGVMPAGIQQQFANTPAQQRNNAWAEQIDAGQFGMGAAPARAAAPNPPPAGIAAEMQRRGFVQGPDGKWIKRQ